MALAPLVQASQLSVTAAAGNAIDLRLSQFALLAAANFAAEFVQSSQLSMQVASVEAQYARVSQVAVLVAAIGRPTFRRARAWTFTLDNHDFYVLRIGEYETLVFDLQTGEWAVWKTDTRSTWRAHLGQNWNGAAQANYIGGLATNVVGGDDTYGVLWTLDPTKGVDDPPLDGQELQYFERVVTAGIPMFMRNSPRHNRLYLTLQLGEPVPLATEITLFISDDQGNNFRDAGAVSIEAGDYTQEVMWRSLGLIKSPGRIMELRDRGAATAFYALNAQVSAGGAYNQDEQ